MKILIDESMSYARGLSSRLGEVIAVPGRSTPVAQLADVDALMVRSVTKVNESSLAGKPIKLAGTAIAGTDHADEAWSERTGIGFSATPGYNAITAVEYVFPSLLVPAERDEFSLHERTVGIVDIGSVGCRLQARLEALGIKTLLCDSPRVDREDKEDFRSLDELIQHADTLTFHTPPLKNGPHKTLHLADERLIRSLKPGATLVNACRGAVTDSTASLTCLNEGWELGVVLDAWEGESKPNMELPKKVDIDTPRIVGYILEDKACGTTQVFEAYNKFIGHEQHVALDTLLPAPELGRITLRGPLDQPTLKRLVHLVYDMRRDDIPLRKVTGVPGKFDKLRRNYLERRERSSLYVTCNDASATSLLRELGFNTVHHPAC